ncbi:MAG TPA: nitrile hydratase accessory protein [Steroidobacteraceae bacterium]|nr:nitrile hydratase accessory protein [Steroidobacteraceae bacterium]
MSTSKPPDPVSSFAHLDGPIGLPRDGAAPVFAEPWQAQAFALAVTLAKQGCFTWSEWAACLGEQIKHAGGGDGSQYYHHWLAALERLVIHKGLCDSRALHDRREAWESAYRHTPHGKPVELKRGAPAAR